MPQTSRHYCSRCKQSVYNCMIDGVRVPLVLYFVVGQPGDTGPAVGLNDPGVKVPSFVRALMESDVARAELCMACAGEVFGVPAMTWDLDPALDANGNAIPDIEELRAQRATLGEVEYFKRLHARVFDAITNGRGPNAVLATPRIPTPPPTTGEAPVPVLHPPAAVDAAPATPTTEPPANS